MAGPTLFTLGNTAISLAGTSGSIGGMTSIGTSIITATDSLTLNSGTSIFFDDSSNNHIMTITPGGSVGIGTSTPTGVLDINGEFSAKNPGWYFYNGATGGAVTYTDGEVFGSSNAGSYYFTTATTYNGASLSAWDEDEGVFTFPTSGMYIINIFFFIQSATSGRGFQFHRLDSGGSLTDKQYLFFSSTSLSLNHGRTTSYTRYFNVGEKFKLVHNDQGSTTITFSSGAGNNDFHTSMVVNKIN